VTSDDSQRRRLILASGSPRRRELLADAGYRFDVHPPAIEEPGDLADRMVPAGVAEALSFLKARSVADGEPDAIVLGADTVVAAGAHLYGKPADVDDARRILLHLMSQPHDVITGVTLIDTSTRNREIAHARTRVTMRPMREQELTDYLESGLWQGKAGAYGIQDHDDAFVTHVDGSFTNVVGLPMELTRRMLADYGVTPH